MNENPAMCRHCNRREARRTRGLCYVCYNQSEIRRLYPYQSASKYASKVEPTQEEVDATVAQQMANLPEWWNQSGTEDE